MAHIYDGDELWCNANYETEQRPLQQNNADYEIERHSAGKMQGLNVGKVLVKVGEVRKS